MTGATISHYRILEKIGGGGMGVVYKAEDSRLRRTIAIKFLAPELTRDDRAKERFVREARLASSLDHPHICTVHEVDETADGHVFLVMSFYDGESLKHRIERGPLAIEHAIDLATQIADGLASAHARGIVHRDIKPANVMVTRDDAAKIVDFGLAKLPEMTAITQVGSTWGTVNYMSPEQARGEPVDHRTDLWALGIVLYEMLVGRVPFKGDSAQASMYAILNAPPEPIQRMQGTVPGDLGRIVSRALAKSAGDRYQSAQEFAADLRACRRKIDSGAALAAATPRVPSIAVLPFSDMSAARDQDYFCEGMAEEIINALTALPGVRVASRTSSFKFKARAVDVGEIASQLKVETILDGSVRKAGNRLRITAQLVNASDGYQLWSERYDRDIDDVFAVQDEIARAIVDKLKVKLSGDASAPLVKRQTDNLDAYNRYLQGRYYWTRRYSGFFEKAVEYFEQAIAEDPSYAPAYAGLADAHSVMGLYGLAPPTVAFPKARTAAERALALDPLLAEAHQALGLIQHRFGWDWAGAERSYRRAIEISPNSAALGGLSLLLAIQGRSEEALAEAARARAREPVSALIAFYVSAALCVAGQHDGAVAECTRGVELDPNFPLIYWIRTLALSFQARHEEAIAAARRGVELVNRQSWFLGVLGCAYASAGRREAAEEVLAELDERSRTAYVAPIAFAEIYTALGETDRAIEWLERAYDDRNGWLDFIGTLPLYDPLRGNPRFRSLLGRIGLGEREHASGRTP